MRVGIKKLLMLIGSILLCVGVFSVAFAIKEVSALESTNRNEGYAPDEYNVAIHSVEGYEKIYENKNFEYYYSGKKMILRILNKKSGYVWSTGEGSDTKAEMTSKCSGISLYSDEYYACAIDAGPKKNGDSTDEIYAEVNGLLYFTFFSGTNKIVKKTFTSAEFLGHSKYANEWMFKVVYNQTNATTGNVEFDFRINMRLTFTDDGFDVNIYDEDVTGETAYLISSIVPLPRLGQSGGKMLQCRIENTDENGKGNCVFDAKSTLIDNPRTNLSGYIFVPDGSGALIRFDDVKYYDADTDFYYDMYGDPYRNYYDDLEFKQNNEVKEAGYVPKKQIMMPVWGVSYGNNQDAFVAYVKKGAEYFGLVYKGRTKDSYEYASIQPRFERNRKYVFVFGSKSSDQYLTEKEAYHYDVSISYNFLQGDGSDGELPANYVGMALKYRDYLLKHNLVNRDVELNVGPRVDFLMSDVKRGILGYQEVHMTNTNDIVNMLNDLHDDGINNVFSSLFGWQSGGVSKGKPWKVKYNNKSGGKKGFKHIFNVAEDYGYDVAFQEEYAMINESQTKSYNAYCVKTLQRNYGYYILSESLKPITWWEYVNANVQGKWLNKQAKKLAKLHDNMGINTGSMSTLLVPDYGKGLTYQDAANALYQATKEAKEKYGIKLSGNTPNFYLWRNYENFLNISVYNTQYQCETDSVPFLEILLGGLVNMYAEYSNFSFYDDISQLKMIDYNINPSFIITASENTDIMYTNSRDWFSTAYSRYHPIIKEICAKVLPILEKTKGKTIVDRKVVKLPNNELGLYVNTYATYENSTIGDEKVVVAVNYLDHDVTYDYNGQMINIEAKSAKILS